MSIDDILESVSVYQCGLVEITGGEPLLQNESFYLMIRLIEAGKKVILETNGTIDISKVPERVTIVMDVKCPSSGVSDKNMLSNLNRLRSGDEIKFVIGNRSDFEWAISIMDKFRLRNCDNSLLFSPVSEMLEPSTLAGWILDKGIDARMHLQLHKYIWSNDVRGK